MSMTKVMALYLPQFHRTPENDCWWGEGFTEWDVVKKSRQYFKNIEQPRVPEYGYYDLSKVESIKEQVTLAKKYNVDGFIIYNYYSNGELLLSKPSELILDNQDIDIEFCFSWANHDWMRTWFAYDKEMLRKQEYANNEEQIREHYDYLRRFFLDYRYSKIDNKPVIFIYQVESIPDFNRYIKVWNELAVKDGFDGIYFVQTLGGEFLDADDRFDAIFDFEPTYTTFKYMKLRHKICRVKRGIKKITKMKIICNKFSYKKVTNKIIKRSENDANHFLGCFAEWDNTPRHGDNGTVFTGFSLELFKKQFDEQYRKSLKYNKPMLIIDAWNEWGEGAYLEPDTTFGTKKLEIIKEVVDKYK